MNPVFPRCSLQPQGLGLKIGQFDVIMRMCGFKKQ